MFFQEKIHIKSIKNFCCLYGEKIKSRIMRVFSTTCIPVAPRELCESHLLLLGATSGAPLVVTHLVVVVVVTSCDNLNLNISASFQPILLLFVSYGAPMWGILFFIFKFWISKIFWEGGPKIGGGVKNEKM